MTVATVPPPDQSMPDLPEIRFDHTGIITPCVEDSVRFWETILGFEAQPLVERKQPWISQFLGLENVHIKIAHLYGHGTHIEFIEFVTPSDGIADQRLTQGNVAHICLTTTDVDALRARIIAGGGADQGRIVSVSEGYAKGSRGLYMTDPHGVLIEVLSTIAFEGN